MSIINKNECDNKQNEQPKKKYNRRFKSSETYYGFEEIIELSEIRRLAEIESRYKQNW